LHPFFYTATYATLIVLILLLIFIGVSPGIVIENIKQFLLLG
jgi:NADH-quinone oxidoreductase subunit N